MSATAWVGRGSGLGRCVTRVSQVWTVTVIISHVRKQRRHSWRTTRWHQAGGSAEGERDRGQSRCTTCSPLSHTTHKLKGSQSWAHSRQPGNSFRVTGFSVAFFPKFGRLSNLRNCCFILYLWLLKHTFTLHLPRKITEHYEKQQYLILPYFILTDTTHLSLRKTQGHYW